MRKEKQMDQLANVAARLPQNMLEDDKPDV